MLLGIVISAFILNVIVTSNKHLKVHWKPLYVVELYLHPPAFLLKDVSLNHFYHLVHINGSHTLITQLVVMC
jgi:hypothetical protein